MTIEVHTYARQIGHEVVDSGQGIPWVNASGVETREVSGVVNHVAREIASWVDK